MAESGADVFLSYARKDVTEREQFLTAARAFGLTVWADEYNIDVGDDWEREIEDALAAAKVGACLVSANFLASEFIKTKELPAVLAKAPTGVDARRQDQRGSPETAPSRQGELGVEPCRSASGSRPRSETDSHAGGGGEDLHGPREHDEGHR